jgi:hypothetical protein
MMKTARTDEERLAAQKARYLTIHRPLSFLDPNYRIENPEEGGLRIEQLFNKYNHSDGLIGTAVLLSVLEHVADPFRAADDIWRATKPGSLCVVSVPWIFPHHPGSGEDNWRFSPSGLRHVFSNANEWDILACDWRLSVPAEAGIIDLKTGRAQTIQSCYLVARAL